MMSENIKVYPEILKVQLAYSDGWKAAAGHKVVIQGIEFSFVPKVGKGIELVISSLDCGGEFITLPLNFFYSIFGADKEETLKIFEEKALVVEKIINKKGKNYFLKVIENYKNEFESQFGKMPPIELYDMSDVPEDVKEVLNEP